jgi:Putative DNA-binding domain
VPALVEVQTQIRNALLEGSGKHALPFLVGGSSPVKRLAIHQRHYEASLMAALLAKFPACVWLVGASLVTEAARAFVHGPPPTAPCIAEYGVDFPTYLASRPEALRFPYLQSFAQLEWHLSHIAIAVEYSPVGVDALAAIDREWLADSVLKLQPGLRYFAAPGRSTSS